jgi:hypothetical protein
LGEAMPRHISPHEELVLSSQTTLQPLLRLRLSWRWYISVKQQNGTRNPQLFGSQLPKLDELGFIPATDIFLGGKHG